MKKLISTMALCTSLSFCVSTPAQASGFPVVDIAGLTQALQEYIQQMSDYATQLDHLEQMKKQYEQQMMDAAKPFKTAFDDANKIIGSGLNAYNYVNSLYGKFQDVQSFIKNSSGSYEEWEQCALSPTCNPVDKAFDAYKRLGGLSDGAASVAAELGDSIHSTVESTAITMESNLKSSQGQRAVMENVGAINIAQYKQDGLYQSAVLKSLAAIDSQISAQNKLNAAISAQNKKSLENNKAKLNATKVGKFDSLVLK